MLDNDAVSGNDAPRSTSSAMPDLSSPNVPQLKARVHSRLTPADYARIPLSSLKFRRLLPEDYDEMVALHKEWFPVSYDEAFYTKSVHGEIFTIVATHCNQQADCLSCLKPGASSGSSDCLQNGDDLLGMITLSTSCEHHSDDIFPVLGGDCATLCRKREKGNESCVEDDQCSQGCLAYILTLGVVDGFRRKGLASELLTRSVEHVRQEWPHVQAVYLHVVTYNDAAIKLYESSRFLRISCTKAFYWLHGKHYDSFLYALYVNGARPSWKWRLRSFFNIGFTSSLASGQSSSTVVPSSSASASSASSVLYSSLSPPSWKSWVVNTWRSFWCGDAEKQTFFEEP